MMTFISDDVSMQNMLLHWKPFSGNIFYGDKDVSFIFQLPIYWVVSLLISPGREAMLMSGLLLAWINFALVYGAYLYFLRIFTIKQSYLSLLPVLWVSTLGYGLNWIFLGTNFHNLTVGLIFLFLVGISKICRGEIKLTPRPISAIIYLALAALAGIAIANDRYFLYFGIVPATGLIMAHAWNERSRRRRFVLAGSIVILGYLESKLFFILLSLSGMKLLPGVGSPGFVTFENILPYSMNALHGYLIIMGANVFGLPLFSLLSLIAIISLLLAIYVLYAAVQVLKRKQIHTPELTTLTGMFWFAIFAFTFTTFNLGLVETYRYLVVVPFVAPLLIAILGSATSRRRYIHTLLIITIVLNIIGSVVGAAIAYPSREAKSQADNYQLISYLEKVDLHKGYGEYWSANINTYLSKNKARILSISCDSNGNTTPMLWFTDRDSYLKKSDESFYMFGGRNAVCSQEQVRQQFGQPTKELSFEGRDIWVYNFDLIQRMDTGKFQSTF